MFARIIGICVCVCVRSVLRLFEVNHVDIFNINYFIGKIYYKILFLFNNIEAHSHTHTQDGKSNELRTSQSNQTRDDVEEEEEEE